MTLRRVGVWSAAKLSGVLYAAMGLVFGVFMLLFQGVMSQFDFGGQQFFPGPAGLLFGVGSLVTLPILYGVMGIAGGAAAAAGYNVIAGWIGGLEFDLTERQ